MTIDFAWWITVIELPAIAGLVWYAYQTRKDALAAAVRIHDELSDYKLAVAKDYASVGYLKDVEARLQSHLNRIEEKIDRLHREKGR